MVTHTYTRMHTHIYMYTTHSHIDKAFGEGRRTDMGRHGIMHVLGHASLAMGIHWGTLAYIRWGIRLEYAREKRGRETKL